MRSYYHMRHIPVIVQYPFKDPFFHLFFEVTFMSYCSNIFDTSYNLVLLHGSTTW